MMCLGMFLKGEIWENKRRRKRGDREFFLFFWREK
jgi:hypothetical protein